MREREQAERVASYLAERLAWATECQIATVEGLEDVKRSSQYAKRRHREIAAKMVEACRVADVFSLGVDPRRYSRVRDAIAALATPPSPLGK